MNAQAQAIPQRPLNSGISGSERYMWCLRRELWENRWLYYVPLGVAVLGLIGFLFNLPHLSENLRNAVAGQEHDKITDPYMNAALLMMGTTFVMAIIYSIDALQGERRDRSILFWKSLPVSDLTTVLAKASIPIVFLPLLTLVVTVAVHWIMVLLSAAVLMVQGESVSALFAHLSLGQMWLTLAYHLLGMHGLYYAPIFGWLLMVSAWSRRAAFLWAVVPPLVIAMVEKIAFNTSYFGHLIQYRIVGDSAASNASAATSGMGPLATSISPEHFLISPGLWFGLALTALFLAAAVRLRRYRTPN